MTTLNPADFTASVQTLFTQAQEGAKVWMKMSDQVVQECERQVQASAKMMGTLQEHALANRAAAMKLATESFQHSAAMAETMMNSWTKAWGVK